jgi:hypothetical protein
MRKEKNQIKLNNLSSCQKKGITKTFSPSIDEKQQQNRIK